MREIAAQTIRDAVRDLCIEACCTLPADVRHALEDARATESWGPAQVVLDTILENLGIAESGMVPICQDTGIACVFVDIGQDVHVEGDLEAAINAGVAAGYTDGYLRKSMVRDPLRRVNTKTNEPALITYRIVAGDDLRIVVAPKGAGSENMSSLVMLTPADGREGVIREVVEAVRNAGPNPCPPIVVGVGIGGNSDHAMDLAKRALQRRFGERNPDPFYAELEEELIERIAELGIGPMGYGGDTTALAVHVEALPTHIACLPLGIAINCHAARHAEVVL
ncbi:MAG: fumarate hydratase [Atopobiaceae bacterium]|nr:fumarate hydratase [Atopobiaceae bacterium]